MKFVFISANSFSVVILFVAVFSLSNAYHYVVMKAESTSSGNDFCVYSKLNPSLPKQANDAKSHMLEIGSVVDWCTNDSKSNASDKVLLLPSGNCSLSSQIQNFYCMGGKVILFISNGSLGDMNSFECENRKGGGISSMIVSKSTANVLKEMDGIITVKFFQPSGIPGVYFLLILELIAIFTAAVGSYMSGRTSYETFKERVTKRVHAGVEVPKLHTEDIQPKNRWLKIKQLIMQSTNKIEISEENGTPVIVLTPCLVIYIVITCVVILVIGYFLKEYLLNFFLILFTLVSIFCLQFCLYSWTRKYRSHFFKFTLTVCKNKIVISSLFLILLIISFGVPIVWLIFRKAKYTWMLQNVLCMFYCFVSLKLLRFSSLKACTILLLLLFLVDIFFVLITPLFTKNGKSVMGEFATLGNMEKLNDQRFIEDVAAGRQHLEFVPGMMQVRDFGFNPLGACSHVFAVVGLGDIVMPGLMLSYCYAFDLCSINKIIYYPTSVISYAIGMFLSHLALEFWNSEQPALLFIVPSVFIPIVLLGWFRGELSTLWYGLKVVRKTYGRKTHSTEGQNSRNVNLPLDELAETA